MGKLKREVEKAKRTLSSQMSTRIEIDSFHQGKDFSDTLSRAKFEELNHDLFKKTLKTVEQVLRDAKVAKSDINDIVLVGGSTRIPKVQQLLEEFFDGKKASKHINPDEAVAYGAAIQGGILSGADGTGPVALIDVNPLTLGIETTGGVMTKLIPRNTQIPTQKSQIFSTAVVSVRHDPWLAVSDLAAGQPSSSVYPSLRRGALHDRRQQLSGQIRAYGDSSGATCKSSMPRLSELSLKAVKGAPQIEVSFGLDANGILKVSASDKGTGQSALYKTPSIMLTHIQGKSESVTITNDNGRLTQEEIGVMIADAQKFAEEDKATAERVMSRNGLENYAINLKNQVTDAEGLGGKLDEDEKETVRIFYTYSFQAPPLMCFAASRSYQGDH